MTQEELRKYYESQAWGLMNIGGGSLGGGSLGQRVSTPDLSPKSTMVLYCSECKHCKRAFPWIGRGAAQRATCANPEMAGNYYPMTCDYVTPQAIERPRCTSSRTGSKCRGFSPATKEAAAKQVVMELGEPKQMEIDWGTSGANLTSSVSANAPYITNTKGGEPGC